jgi:hypothetical protein
MIEALIQHLRKNAKLENSTDVERFDATLSQIAALNNPQAIALLVSFLNDNCKFHEVMFSIIHAIERVDDETYIREIINVLPILWKESPYWANVIHFRIFNHATSRQNYRNQLAKAAPTIKMATKELLTKMRKEEPTFVEVCDEMIAVL